MKPVFFPILSAGFLLPATGLAELLSQDSFSGYGLGELPAVANPTVTGYTGDWTDIDWGNAEPAVAAGSLSYAGAGYATGLGNKVSVPSNAPGEITEATSGRVYRLLDSSLTVTDATTGDLYLSFLFQSGQETGATTYQTLALFNTDTTDANRSFDIGFNGGTIYNFGVNDTAGPNQTYHATGVNADTGVHLFVVKFTLSDAALSDSVTVWVDPVLGAGEPAGGTTVSGRDLAWDRLAFSDYDGNSCAWDEVRWGTTFDNVTVESVLPATPLFTLQPTDYFGGVGDTFSLDGMADSDPAPDFQWEKSADGSTGWVEIPGATSATLGFSPATFADNGYYRVIADNGNEPAATSEVVLVDLIYPAPTIITQPASTSVEVGSNVTLSVEATGLGELTYQWYKDAEIIDGATSDTLELTNVQPADAGDYDVDITDPAGEADGQGSTFALSSPATVGVYEPWSGLVSHDPFAAADGYALGSLATQGPAIAGYTDPWEITNGFGPVSPVVLPGSLAYANPLYLGSSGDSVSTPADTEAINATNSGRVGRLLDSQLVVSDSTTGTRYLSWLFRSGLENAAPDPQVYQTLALFNGVLGTDANRDFDAGIALGDFSTTNFAFRLNNNAAMVGDLGVPSDSNVHLFVAKIELSDTPGGDSVTMWIDPALGSGDPAGGVTVTGADLLWDRIALSDYASDSSAWDEIRWGSSFDSVTLNPNPPDNFATWIGGYPVGLLNGFDDDADGDGIKNGLENVFGTDPSVANQGIAQVATSGSIVTFQHPQSGFPASDVTAAYRWTTDLASFHDSGAESGGTTVTLTPALNTPSAGTTTVTATITGTLPAKLFMVLEANQAP